MVHQGREGQILRGVVAVVLLVMRAGAGRRW